mmetsp:Transcript_22707/g.37416  ORF Transcript_22707/g.37416 Transcript_22707/m.37416 type:complete len:216 (+) Transcript_22707:259-906(+)
MSSQIKNTTNALIALPNVRRKRNKVVFLDGPCQMESVKTYNNLAASIAEYNREKQKVEEERRKAKKKNDEDKEAKKRLQQEQERVEHERMLPGCKEDVEIRGKVFVLGCNLKRKREILKHYFRHDKPLYKTNAPEANELINEYFAKMAGDEAGGGTVLDTAASVGDDALVQRAFEDMIESSNIMVSEKEGEGEAMGVDTETEEGVEVDVRVASER